MGNWFVTGEPCAAERARQERHAEGEDPSFARAIDKLVGN